jgi:hypothetical protein
MQLIIAQQAADAWDIRLLEESDGAAVVWRQAPTKYEGMNEKDFLNARHPVVVLCWYGSSTILCAWTGSEVRKIWLSD